MKYFIALSLAVFLSSGCTSYKKNFHNQRVANIGYFADSTIAMMSDLDLTLTREDTLLVRRFIDNGGPEEQQVMQLAGQLKKDLSNLVRYSIEIVNIAESDQEEALRIENYALFLYGFRDADVDSNGRTYDLLEDALEEVVVQTEFLKALRKAQPLLNAKVLAAALEVDELIEAVRALSLIIDERIDAEYADIIRYRAKLEREKFDILTAFEIIYDAYRNEEPDLGELRRSGVIWMPEIIPEGRPEREDLQAIGEHLHKRLKALDIIQNEIKPNWEDYMATHRELDIIVDDTIRSVHQARIIMLTWVRAHQKMSAGTTDPAGWLDIGEVTKSLVKSAPGAVL